MSIGLLAVVGVTMLTTAAHAVATTAAYRAVGPRRLADTRPTSSSGFSRIDGHTIRVVVDAEAVAATLTVTAVDTSAAGFVTVWPTGASRPEVSNLNVTRAGEVRANTVTVRLGMAGSVDVYVQTPTQLIVDLVGLFDQTADATAGRYQPSNAGRVLDTREPGFGATPLKARGQRNIPLPADVPTDAIAVAANLTFTGTLGAGFFTAWPAGAPLPQASTGNADGPGQTRAIFTIVPVSATGFSIYTQGGAHVVVDIVGYFTGTPDVATTQAMPNQPPATFTFGSSADRRALVAAHREGSDNRTRDVLVIGSMHGEEPAGIRVVDALATIALPPDLDLWTLRTMNPDGLATGTRRNGNDVDLNRNWPGSLYPSVVTSGSGPYPMSEPENQALMRLVSAIESRQPLDWAISYHQPLSTIDCDPDRGQRLLSACSAFSKTTGTPMQAFLRIPGTMTDTMNGLGKGQWFTVEFGATQPAETEVTRHVTAISLIGR